MLITRQVAKTPAIFDPLNKSRVKRLVISAIRMLQKSVRKNTQKEETIMICYGILQKK